MSDGQSEAFLPPDKEEDPGVFTVANKNDTDGDSIPDSGDNNVVDGDVDLMKMKVNRFTNYNPATDGEKMGSSRVLKGCFLVA